MNTNPMQSQTTQKATSQLSVQEIQNEIANIPHWHHIITFPKGVTSPGTYDPSGMWNRFTWPDLKGKRVLDVGVRDGFFALECEKRGAEVVMVDNLPYKQLGISVVQKAFNLSAKFYQRDVDVDRLDDLGSFDIVLCLGLIYHVRHPLLVLDKIRSLCTGELFFESYVCDDQLDENETRPISQYMLDTGMHPDKSVMWVPNSVGAAAWLKSANFQVTYQRPYKNRTEIQAKPI